MSVHVYLFVHGKLQSKVNILCGYCQETLNTITLVNSIVE